jgi:bacterioferritin (cytochrome b1)
MKLDQFLEFMNEDLMREWTHLKFYLYHASAVTGLHAEEFREWLTDSAKGEMEHVQQFLDRLFGLAYAQPAQSAHSFPMLFMPADILAYAAKLENEVVTKYAERLKQLEEMDHPTAAYLKVFYEDQLQDSFEDCERILRMLSGEVGQAHIRQYRYIPKD